MPTFLFRFGYCPPNLWEQNELYGWDDEDSSAFMVSAPTSEDALRWGSEVAEAFTRRLFQQSGWDHPPSWKEAQFSHWIDENPEQSFEPAMMVQLPKVSYEELPDFNGWK